MSLSGKYLNEKYIEYPNRRNGLKFCLGLGLEVGALHHPSVIPIESDVEYIDYKSGEELLEQYKNDKNVPKDKVVFPDYVGDIDNGLLKTFEKDKYNFFIMNHVIEHIYSPFLAVKQICDLLKVTGVMFLAVPDKRFTFDNDRELTDYEHLINDYRNHEFAINDHKDQDFHAHLHVWTAMTFHDHISKFLKEENINLKQIYMYPLEKVNLEYVGVWVKTGE